MNKTQLATHLKNTASLMMNDPHTFEPGDLVTWKNAALADRTQPVVGDPAIVLEIFDEPILPWKNHMNEEGSHYTWGRIDMILGIIVGDDDELKHFGVDSRRFKPFTE